MKTIENCAAQGDVRFDRVESIPAEYVEAERSGDVVVTHSETGHHHVIREANVLHYHMPPGSDGMTSYLRIGGEYADVVHLRGWDTHETLRLRGGVWRVRRQREYTPQGWRKVED